MVAEVVAGAQFDLYDAGGVCDVACGADDATGSVDLDTDAAKTAMRVMYGVAVIAPADGVGGRMYLRTLPGASVSVRLTVTFAR